jgi:hypothetical protein
MKVWFETAAPAWSQNGLKKAISGQDGQPLEQPVYYPISIL